jgi:radical SAM superfamily enzyme YgiQ (UPF0313 family)
MIVRSHFSSNIRVLLVYPRFRLPSGDPPLGIAYIASALIETGKVDVRIFDATFSPSMGRAVTAIKEFDPDIVGIYVDTFMYNDAIAIAGAAKQLGKFVVTGGPHATVMPETLTQYADIIVIGEAEQTFVEIIEKYDDRDFGTIQGIFYKEGKNDVKTADRITYLDLDSIKSPAFELLDMKSYTSRWHYLDSVDTRLRGTNLIGSRGCPFDCTYCQPTLRCMFGTVIRSRSPENIVEEIKRLKHRYHLDSFFFHDDTFTVDKNRLITLCEQILKADLKIFWGCNSRVDTVDRDLMEIMYSAGLRKLHLGAESGCQRILDTIYNKAITTEQVRHVTEMAKDVGVRCFCFFILGAPSETREEIRRTIDFACSLPIDEVSFSILTPLPGTEIFRSMRADSRYSVSTEFSDFNYYSKRAFNDPDLPAWQVKFCQFLAHLRFYTDNKRWPYLLNHFKSAGGIKKLARKVVRSF